MTRTHLQYVAKVTLQAAGSPAGTVSNNWAFLWNGTGTPVATDFTALENAVIKFYGSTTAGTQQVYKYLGNQLGTIANSHECALYDIDTEDLSHAFGSPVHMQFFSLGTPSTSQALPNEVAATVSFRAPYGTDPEHLGTLRPRASDRGRVYIGPLAANVLGDVIIGGGQHIPELSFTFISDLAAALKEMKAGAASHNWGLSVWSRKEKVFKLVTQYAVDTIPDTIRKRGPVDSLQTWTPFP